MAIPWQVTLGEFGPLNLVGVPTDTEIVVEFPAGGLPAGDFLLTVSTGTGQSQNDEYDLTIGAAPSELTCPCEGLSAGGVTWDSTFNPVICQYVPGDFSPRLSIINPNDGALIVQEFNTEGTYSCVVVQEDFPNPITQSVRFNSKLVSDACKRSLRAIAEEDGVDSCLP